MSILSKVMVGFLSIAAMCFFYMAMRTLKTHAVHRKNVADYESAITKMEAKLEKSINGDKDQGIRSIDQLETDLHAALFGRGRVWRNGARAGAPDANGVVTVTTDQPQPPQIDVGAVLYLFDALDQDPRGPYIGEFKVSAVNGQDVTLEPTLKLSATKLQTLSAARGPLTLYEYMPVDSHAVFAGLTDAEVQAFMPRAPQQFPGEDPESFRRRQEEYQQLVIAYQRDGKPATPDDPAERVVVLVKFTKDHQQLDQNTKNALAQMQIPPEVVKLGQVLAFDKPTAEEFIKLEIAQDVERRFQRSLNDYRLMFLEYNRKLPILLDRVAAATKELQYATESLNDAKTHETFHRDEIAKLEVEKKRLGDEVKLVSDYEKSLETRVQAVQARIAELYVQNKQLAAQLAQRQLQAVGRANQATAAARPATVQ